MSCMEWLPALGIQGMIVLVPAASKVILRQPEAVFETKMLCWSRSDWWPSVVASCFGHTGVTFDAENDRPGPGSLRGHFGAPEDIFLD